LWASLNSEAIKVAYNPYFNQYFGMFAAQHPTSFDGVHPNEGLCDYGAVGAGGY
jgi:hypothetical protein